MPGEQNCVEQINFYSRGRGARGLGGGEEILGRNWQYKSRETQEYYSAATPWRRTSGYGANRGYATVPVPKAILQVSQCGVIKHRTCAEIRARARTRIFRMRDFTRTIKTKRYFSAASVDSRAAAAALAMPRWEKKERKEQYTNIRETFPRRVPRDDSRGEILPITLAAWSRILVRFVRMSREMCSFFYCFLLLFYFLFC